MSGIKESESYSKKLENIRNLHMYTELLNLWNINRFKSHKITVKIP